MGCERENTLSCHCSDEEGLVWDAACGRRRNQVADHPRDREMGVKQPQARSLVCSLGATGAHRYPFIASAVLHVTRSTYAADTGYTADLHVGCTVCIYPTHSKLFRFFLVQKDLVVLIVSKRKRCWTGV